MMSRHLQVDVQALGMSIFTLLDQSYVKERCL